MAALTAAELAHRWIELYNDGTPDDYGSERFLELYHDDVAWTEMPSSLAPEGRSGGLEGIRATTQFGQASLRNRHATVRDILADGDRVVLRYLWEAIVAVDGLPAPRGAKARMEMAAFFRVTDGKIAEVIGYQAILPPDES